MTALRSTGERSDAAAEGGRERFNSPLTIFAARKVWRSIFSSSAAELAPHPEIVRHAPSDPGETGPTGQEPARQRRAEDRHRKEAVGTQLRVEPARHDREHGRHGRGAGRVQRLRSGGQRPRYDLRDRPLPLVVRRVRLPGVQDLDGAFRAREQLEGTLEIREEEARADAMGLIVRVVEMLSKMCM